MLLNHTKRLPPKCQVARYVRFPKVSPKNTYKPISHHERSFYASSIHIVHDEKYATLYYMPKDVCYFYNTTLASLRSIVPLYHYTSGKYVFRKAGLEYTPLIPIPISWYSVKAPNGDIYIVYMRSHSGRGDLLCVYNLTKNRNVHCVENFTKRLYEEPVEKYSRILANSFIIIYTQKHSQLRIDLVDLVSETVDTFRYTIRDYLNGLLTVIDDEIDKKRIVDMLSELNNTSLSEYYWYHLGIMYTVNNREDSVPFINYYELRLGLDYVVDTIFNRMTTALLVTCRVENNELSIKLTTWKNGVIKKSYDPTFKVTIPDNAILFSKRYNLDDRHNISHTYPYYIHEVAQNYIFITDGILEKHPYYKNDYIMHPTFSYIYIPEDKRQEVFHHVNGINILRSEVMTMAQLKRSYAKDGRKLGVIIVEADIFKKFLHPAEITFLDRRKVHKFLQEKIHAKDGYSEPFVDVSQFMFKVDILEKIRSILKLSQKEIERFKRIEKRLPHYIYVDDVEGLLYILIILLPKKEKNDDSDEGDTFYWLCKCNVLEPKVPCEVITKLHITNSGKVKDFINTVRHNVHLLKMLSNLTQENMRIQLDTYTRAYIHDKILITTNDGFDIKIDDFKQNRSSILQYIKSIPEIVSTRMDCDVYQDDCLICLIQINPRFGDSIYAYYPLVFKDLIIVKSVQID